MTSKKARSKPPGIEFGTVGIQPNRRKGYSRRSDIPTDLLRALNTGQAESATLSEWLAIDIRQLMRAIIDDLPLAQHRQELLQTVDELALLGVGQRSKGVGAALHRLCNGVRKREKVLQVLASSPSDMVRAWGAYMLAADPDTKLATRLENARRFAADSNMSVRECAWDSFRNYVAADLDRGIRLLVPWVKDSDENIRRCAVEATRPRGVWCLHIEALKADPEPGRTLLEHVRSDSSRYVQRAVANWMNDASKTRADWVERLVDRWLRESRTPETKWIVHHALRSLRKKNAST